MKVFGNNNYVDFDDQTSSLTSTRSADVLLNYGTLQVQTDRTIAIVKDASVASYADCQAATQLVSYLEWNSLAADESLCVKTERKAWVLLKPAEGNPDRPFDLTVTVRKFTQ